MSKIKKLEEAVSLLNDIEFSTNPTKDVELRLIIDETYNLIEEVISELKKSNGKTNEEWYTPPDIIERVRRTLEFISLDVASCEAAQKIVKAKRYFDKEDNGLSQFWKGRIFGNPPYGKMTKLFLQKCIESPHVDEAVFLVNRTGAAWYIDLLELGYFKAICRVKKRITFLDENLEVQKSPRYYNDILYYGDFVGSFYDEFSDIGSVISL